MAKPKFDFTISLGNIITVFCGIMATIVWFASVETANAKRDIKVDNLQVQVTKNSLIRDDINAVRLQMSRIHVNQENQEKMLARIINNLERR